MFRRLALLVIAMLLLLPTMAVAQEVRISEDDDVLVRINGPITVAAEQSVDVVVGIDNNVVIDGVVREGLWVIDSNVTVNGRVEGDLVVISGTLLLGPSAVVEDVHLIRSTLVRDPGATITGSLNERAEFFSFSWWDGIVTSALFWIGITLVILVAGLLFAWLGGRQLTALGATARTNWGGSIVAALALLFGLPVLAIGLFFTVIGIPLGLAILFFLIPALWFVGYLVVGTMLGGWIRSYSGGGNGARDVIWAALIGLLVLQVIGLIPFIGGFVVFLAGLLGAGVLVLHLVRRPGAAEPAIESSAVTAPAH